MTKRPKPIEKPKPHQMNFGEAMDHFSQADPAETAAERGHDRNAMVPLTEDDSGHRFLVYTTPAGMRVDLRYDGATFWASQGQMAEMFGVKQHTVSEHINRVFSDGELADTEATHRKFRSVRREGNRDVARDIEHYDLNTLISVGYRVGSTQGTMFRIWSTDKIFQILTKGFHIDKDRLMNRGEPDALEEFKQTARQIRTSIRNSYREVLQLCTLCSDCSGSSEAAKVFFMAMENKLLWAASNKTVPQLILERADAEQHRDVVDLCRGTTRSRSIANDEGGHREVGRFHQVQPMGSAARKGSPRPRAGQRSCFGAA